MSHKRAKQQRRLRQLAAIHTLLPEVLTHEGDRGTRRREMVQATKMLMENARAYMRSTRTRKGLSKTRIPGGTV